MFYAFGAQGLFHRKRGGVGGLVGCGWSNLKACKDQQC